MAAPTKKKVVLKTKKAKKVKKKIDPNDVSSPEEPEVETQETEPTVTVPDRKEIEPEANEPVNTDPEAEALAMQSYNSEYPGHSFQADWPGRDVFVAFPCHKHVNPGTMWAMIATALDLGKPKVRFDISMGDAIIENARNRLAHRFIEESDAEWIMWIDDDVIPPIGRADWFRWIGNNKLPDHIAGQHYIPRLKSHNKSIVGGCYHGRQAAGLPVFNQGRVNPDAFNAAKRGTNMLLPTEWTGTGCMLTHRSVFEDIKKTFPDLAPTDQYPFWNYFFKDQGLGEDVSFCLRAKAAGHQVFTDVGLQCLHVGYSCYGMHNTAQKLNPDSM